MKKKFGLFLGFMFLILVAFKANTVYAVNYVPKKDYSNNLVAQYKFEETSGNTCIDSKGNYNGTYYNTTSVIGIAGNAIQFNGNTADSRIEFTSKVIPEGRKSIKFKIKTNFINTSDSYMFSTMRDLNTNSIGIGISVTKNGYINFALWNRDNTSIGFALKNGFDIRDGNWHDVLCTWTGDTQVDGVKVYIDNIAIPKNIGTSKINDTAYTNNFVIGRQPIDTNVADRRFVGQLDEIEIYNEVVEYEIKAESISLDKTSLNLLEGTTEKLTATVLPEDATNKKVVWTSSDSSVAVVDENGNVVAIKEGQAVITATTTDGTNLTATCNVTVTKPVTNWVNMEITMTNGQNKKYNLPMVEVDKFINWYIQRTAGVGKPFYEFAKTTDIAPFIKKTEYVIFDKISSFEINEYKVQ